MTGADGLLLRTMLRRLIANPGDYATRTFRGGFAISVDSIVSQI